MASDLGSYNATGTSNLARKALEILAFRGRLSYLLRTVFTLGSTHRNGFCVIWAFISSSSQWAFVCRVCACEIYPHSLLLDPAAGFTNPWIKIKQRRLLGFCSQIRLALSSCGMQPHRLSATRRFESIFPISYLLLPNAPGPGKRHLVNITIRVKESPASCFNFYWLSVLFGPFPNIAKSESWQAAQTSPMAFGPQI